MRHFLKSLLITIATLYIAYTFIPTVILGTNIKNLLIVVAGFWLLFQIINPLFSLVLLPINLVTFSLVSFVLNVAFVYALINFLPGFKISPYNFPGASTQGIIIPAMRFNLVETIIIAAVLISVVQKILHLIFE